ncbi:MAG: phosphatase PAP2 family protein [Dehalococcoidales bacterium]
MRRLLVPGAWILALLLLVSLSYLAYRYTPLSGEGDVLVWLAGVDLPWMSPLMEGTSFLGDTIPATITVAVAVVTLLLYRRRRDAVFFAAVPALSALFSYLIKLLVARPRPDELLASSGLSFPSGHVTYAAAIGGFAWYLAPRVLPQRTAVWAVRGLMALFVVLTAVSRMYLEAHWPSDVAGGLLLAGLCVAAAARWHGNRTPARILPEVNDAGTA